MTTTWTEARLESLTDAYLTLCGETPHDELVATAARQEGARLSQAINYLRSRNLRGE